MRPADADNGSITNRQPNLWYMTEPVEPNQKSNSIWYVAFMGFYNYIDFKMRINAELISRMVSIWCLILEFRRFL